MSACKKCGGTDRYRDGGCKACKKVRSHELYEQNASRKNELGAKWRAEHPDYDRNRYLANKEEVSKRHTRNRIEHLEAYKMRDKAYYRKKGWAAHLKHAYGVTLEEYDLMLKESCGRCAICERQFGDAKNEPCVDHNHETGQVRGLLHRNCNVAIGLLDDNSKLTNLATEYLRKYERS